MKPRCPMYLMTNNNNKLLLFHNNIIVEIQNVVIQLLNKKY